MGSFLIGKHVSIDDAIISNNKLLSNSNYWIAKKDHYNVYS